MNITYVDGQALSASELNLSFAGKMDVNGDASALSVLINGSNTPRVLADRFSDTINVLDYVTYPDGIADNTARLQAAINAGANRARVLFPQTAFPFSATGLTIPPNSCLVIDGIILQRPGASTSLLRVLTGAKNVSITGNGMLDGNATNETLTSHAIEVTTGSNIYLSNLTIQNTLLSPVFFSGVNQVLVDNLVAINCKGAMTFQNGCSNVWVRNSYINGSGADGIYFHGGAINCAVSDSTIATSAGHGISSFHDTTYSAANSNLIFRNNAITGSGKTGIIVHAGTGAVGNHTFIQIIGNRLTSNNALNVTGIGSISNKTGTYVRISDNQISKDGAGALASYGVLVGGSDTQITNNQISAIGQGGVLGVGIVLVNTANRVLISGNQIIDDQVSKTMNYGISGNAGTGVMVFDNQINGMITAPSALVNAADTLVVDGSSGTLIVTGPFATAGAAADQSAVVVVPVTAFTTTIANGISTYIMAPAGTLAAGTLTMPPAPIQGQVIRIISTQTITSFTLSANSGQTISGAPTTASFGANQAIVYIFNGTNWYRGSSSTPASAYDPTNVSISGGSINSTSVGATTPGTGAFTTLSASGTVSGTGFVSLLATPGPIGSGTASTGAFSTLTASGAISGTGFTNLFAAPPSIGNTTPGTGAFTTLSATSTVSGAGITARFATPGPIGNTVASTGAFTTLATSGAVSGAGFVALLAAPGPVGSTTPSTAAFTTLAASGAVSGAGFVGLLAAPGPIGSTTPSTGAFTTLSASSTAVFSSTASGVTASPGDSTTKFATTAFVSNAIGAGGIFVASNVAITGGTIDGTSIGATTTSTGSFTTLAASGAVSGTGFTNRFATPGPIGNTTASTGAFTTLSASSTVSGTGFSTYLASPPAIGGSAPAAGSFTTLSASSTVSGAGFSTYLASPPAIGGSSAAAGSFTTLSASSTVSGTGFSTYLASPPAIGGTVAAAGAFTTLNASSNTMISGTTTLSGALISGVRVITIAGAVTVLSTDRYVVINKGTPATTAVTLPSSPATGLIINIKDGAGNSASFNITVSAASGNIDGAATNVLNTNFASVDYIFNGTQWSAV